MLDKNKCYEHYRKEVLKEGFNINIIRKFVDNVANTILSKIHFTSIT